MLPAGSVMPVVGSASCSNRWIFVNFPGLFSLGFFTVSCLLSGQTSPDFFWAVDETTHIPRVMTPKFKSHLLVTSQKKMSFKHHEAKWLKTQTQRQLKNKKMVEISKVSEQMCFCENSLDLLRLRRSGRKSIPGRSPWPVILFAATWIFTSRWVTIIDIPIGFLNWLFL